VSPVAGKGRNKRASSGITRWGRDSLGRGLRTFPITWNQGTGKISPRDEVLEKELDRTVWAD